MLDPPQDTAADEVGIRSLSAPDLAHLWVELSRAKLDVSPVLREFDRRFWLAQAERASSGDVLTLPAPWRVLRFVPASGADGPEPFAS